ncbi:MAG: hypothetical protein WC365_05360 [Candidatus Babeliales bacterium]|jgi:hypothetical protein
MRTNELAQFYSIGKIREMIKDDILSDMDILDLAAYNPNLFCYVHLKLPFKQFSPLQEHVLDTFYTPEKYYRELLLACGRKAFKSLASACLLLFEVYRTLVLVDDPHEYYGLPSKKKIYYQLLASNREQAQDINFDYIRSLASTSDYLNDKIKNSTNDQLEFAKGLTVKVYNSSARSCRGESSAIVVFDEIAWWIDNRGNLSGDEIYYAVMPNLKILKHEGNPADSKSVLISSPAGRAGIFYELFRGGNHEMTIESTQEAGSEPWRCVFQLPTWKLNPKNQFNCKTCPTHETLSHEDITAEQRKVCMATCQICSSNDLRIDFLKNPERFDQEYGAMFVDTISPAISRDKIELCVVNEMGVDPLGTDKDIPRVLSLDPSLTGDAYGLAMGHLDDENILKIDLLKEWYAFDKNHPIDLKLVQKYVEDIYNNYYITHIVLDQYQSASTVQALQDKGIPAYLLTDTQKLNTEAYERLIARINTEPPKFHIPRYSPFTKKLLNEFYFLQRTVSGKTVRYMAAINSSDNLTDCCARLCYVLEREGNRNFTVDKL